MKQNKQKIQNKITTQDRQKKFAKGFTLLELLVVVLIIGILAAIALPQYKYAVAKAKFTQLKVATKAILEAQQRYMLSNGERSLDLSSLDIDIEGGTTNKDKITFDWGTCSISHDSNRTKISCSLKQPYIVYYQNFSTNQKQCCASASSGKIGKRICQTEFPNSTEYSTNNWCGTGGTVYEGY